jgi:hypothetical protein
MHEVYYAADMKHQISNGIVHKMPLDLGKALRANKKLLVTWEDLTPLARNEWICWVWVYALRTDAERSSLLFLHSLAGQKLH